MGRGKLSLNLIPNRKTRTSTFKKRKNSVMKKAFELSTLCDVPLCVLIHGPDDDAGDRHSLHTWPPNRPHVQALLRAAACNNAKCKTFDLSDFFEDRRAKLLADTSKLRLCPNPNPNPDDDTYLHSLNESQLRAFMASLDSKIQVASAMLDLMESDHFPFAQDDDTPPFLPMMPFIEDPDHQIGLSFDDLLSLDLGFDDQHFTDLINDHSEFDEHCFMSGNHDQFHIDSHLEVMPGNHELLIDNSSLMMMMPAPPSDDFVFGPDFEHSMMPAAANCEFELIANNLDFEHFMMAHHYNF